MEKSKGWSITGWVFIVASAWFGWCAYDKMFNYSNPSSYSSKAVNSYVGGDAYNYIINSNYVTAMCVMFIGCILIGVLCIAIQQWRDNTIENTITQKTLLEQMVHDTSK